MLCHSIVAQLEHLLRETVGNYCVNPKKFGKLDLLRKCATVVEKVFKFMYKCFHSKSTANVNDIIIVLICVFNINT